MSNMTTYQGKDGSTMTGVSYYNDGGVNPYYTGYVKNFGAVNLPKDVFENYFTPVEATAPRDYRGKDGTFITDVTYDPVSQTYRSRLTDTDWSKDFFESFFTPVEKDKPAQTQEQKVARYDDPRNPKPTYHEIKPEKPAGPPKVGSVILYGGVTATVRASHPKSDIFMVEKRNGEVEAWCRRDMVARGGWEVVSEASAPEKTFESELSELLDRYTRKDAVEVSDFVIAQYLKDCLKTFVKALDTLNS